MTEKLPRVWIVRIVHSTTEVIVCSDLETAKKRQFKALDEEKDLQSITVGLYRERYNPETDRTEYRRVKE